MEVPLGECRQTPADRLDCRSPPPFPGRRDRHMGVIEGSSRGVTPTFPASPPSPTPPAAPLPPLPPGPPRAFGLHKDRGRGGRSRTSGPAIAAVTSVGTAVVAVATDPTVSDAALRVGGPTGTTRNHRFLYCCRAPAITAPASACRTKVPLPAHPYRRRRRYRQHR